MDMVKLGAEMPSFKLPFFIELSYKFRNFVVDGRYNFILTNIAENKKGKNNLFQFTLRYNSIYNL